MEASKKIGLEVTIEKTGRIFLCYGTKSLRGVCSLPRQKYGKIKIFGNRINKSN